MYTLGETGGVEKTGVIHRGNLVVVAYFRLQDLLRGEFNAV